MQLNFKLLKFPNLGFEQQQLIPELPKLLQQLIPDLSLFLLMAPEVKLIKEHK